MKKIILSLLNNPLSLALFYIAATAVVVLLMWLAVSLHCGYQDKCGDIFMDEEFPSCGEVIELEESFGHYPEIEVHVGLDGTVFHQPKTEKRKVPLVTVKYEDGSTMKIPVEKWYFDLFRKGDVFCQD